MPFRARAALAAALAAMASTAAAQERAFTPGEQLDFVVDFLHVRTGQARITVGRAEGSVWPVICQAKTDGLATLLDIREHYVSYWDADALTSRGSDLAAVEVGDRHFDSARFDRVRGQATVAVQRKGRRSEATYAIPRDVHDVGSAILWLRLQPLAAGGHSEVPVFTGKETFTLVADVVGREQVSTGAGRFDTVKVKVRTSFGGKFRANRDTFLWFSDDPRHVPVKVSADFAVGTIVATLESYKAGGQMAQR